MAVAYKYWFNLVLLYNCISHFDLPLPQYIDIILFMIYIGKIMGATWNRLLMVALWLSAMAPWYVDAITEADLLKIASSLEMYVDEVPFMSTIPGYTLKRGKAHPANLTIGMYMKKWKFHRDLPPGKVFVYGTSKEAATYPGPTIEVRQGVPTSITFENHLPKKHIIPWDPTLTVALPSSGVPTAVHVHGGIHPPEVDGSALAWFTNGFNETGSAWTIKTYTFPNEIQLPGNLIYHDHALGITRTNMFAGLFAEYVVRNPAIESKLNLPSGEFDRHLFIFDRSFRKDGSLYWNKTGVEPQIHPEWHPEYFGDAMVVNGKVWPYMKVQRRKYRLRINNFGSARYLNISFSNGLQFTQIASDHSFLAKPVNVTSIVLATSETADVVVDFSSSSGEIILTNSAPYPYPNGTAVDSLNSKIMKFIVDSGKPAIPDKSSIPAKLLQYPKAVADSTMVTRYIVLYEYTAADGNPTHLDVNGKKLTDPATETPVTGTSEVWKVINLTPDDHPLHLHLATIQAVEQRELVNYTDFVTCMQTYNDSTKCNISDYATGKLVPVPENERAWKYTLKLMPYYMTTVVARFHYVHKDEPYAFDATASPGYVYHCHITNHEDNEMIRPLYLVNATTQTA